MPSEKEFKGQDKHSLDIFGILALIPVPLMEIFFNLSQ